MHDFDNDALYRALCDFLQAFRRVNTCFDKKEQRDQGQYTHSTCPQEHVLCRHNDLGAHFIEYGARSILTRLITDHRADHHWKHHDKNHADTLKHTGFPLGNKVFDRGAEKGC